MIRAALFDFGGVILSSPFEAFASFERDRQLPEGFLRSVNATDPDTNAWARLERSEVTLDEFGTLFAAESAALGHEVDGREVLGLLMGELRPAMVEAVRRCSEKLVTGLLTNNFVLGDGHVDRETEMGAVLALFDEVIESSKVGVRKPDPRFYELACEQLGIEPTEAVFLDDLGVNLKPAKAMGMTTIKVGDPDVAIAELETVVGFSLR
jgi:putative hydrolase of the HAD superfamily